MSKDLKEPESSWEEPFLEEKIASAELWARSPPGMFEGEEEASELEQNSRR